MIDSVSNIRDISNQFWWFPEFHPVFLFSWAPPLLLHRFSLLHFVLTFSISYWDLIKFPYFTDTSKRGGRGWKEAQRQGEDTVTLRISLFLYLLFLTFLAWSVFSHVFPDLINLLLSVLFSVKIHIITFQSYKS